MKDIYDIERKLKYLGKDLIAELLNFSVIKTIPANIELVKEGQYVKYIPIVLNGLII
jgi:CRP/FNR family transcriptional regulator